jgi:hypothetical protein
LKNALAGATGAYLQTLDRLTLLDILCGLPGGGKKSPSVPPGLASNGQEPSPVLNTKSLTCLKAGGHAEA